MDTNLLLRALLPLLMMLGTTLSANAQSSSESVAPPMYRGSLYVDDQGTLVRKGGSIAALSDSNLYMIVHFGGLKSAWGQIDLFDGDPRSGGQHLQNLAIAIPGLGTLSGGIGTPLTLTPDDIAKLNAGNLYLQIILDSGDPADNVVGQIESDLTSDPTVVETLLSEPAGTRLSRRGLSETFGTHPFQRGAMLAIQEDLTVNLAMYFAHLGSPWTSVDLFKGGIGVVGEHVENLALQFGVDPQTSFGFDSEIELSAELIEDLKAGSLFIKVSTQQPGDELRGQILVYPNTGPEQSTILLPLPGETVVIGGSETGEPVDPGTPLMTVSLSEAADIDGNDVAYFWQISRDAVFGIGSTASVEFGVGIQSRQFTIAEIAALFDSTWGNEERPVFTPVTYYHRALTTDGSAYTFGDPESTTLVRGKVTSFESIDELPVSLTLHGNYPNPFNPTTRVVFDLPQSASVGVNVFNILGQQVLSIGAEPFAAGVSHTIVIEASTLPSGIYSYRVHADTERENLVETGQMIIVK